MDKAVTLHNGIKMPQLGLGVWQASHHETIQAVHWSFEAGYRHVDTAKIYGNEDAVGEAVRSSSIPREELFITTKLWNADQGYESGLRAFDQSLGRLGLEYVDLYLVHWPGGMDRRGAWKALEEIYESGRAKAIGVSNYTIRHLVEMREYANVMPMVNQVEFHPFLYQHRLLEFCREHHIQLEAYSPLARGRRMDDPVIREIAEARGKTPAQVMIRWALQHETVVIPKSVRQHRIQENADVWDFELSDDEMNRLNALNEDDHEAWDPDTIE